MLVLIIKIYIRLSWNEFIQHIGVCTCSLRLILLIKQELVLNFGLFWFLDFVMLYNYKFQINMYCIGKNLKLLIMWINLTFQETWIVKFLDCLQYPAESYDSTR